MLAMAKNEVYKANSSSLNNLVNSGVAKKGKTWAIPVPIIWEETFLENSDFENFDQIFENKLILDFLIYELVSLKALMKKWMILPF